MRNNAKEKTVYHWPAFSAHLLKLLTHLIFNMVQTLKKLLRLMKITKGLPNRINNNLCFSPLNFTIYTYIILL